MHESVGTSGLIFNEPLLWETGAPGRCGMSLPVDDTNAASIDPALMGELPELPELSEIEVVRHYTRLSQWNVGVDSTMYPLGSCTMKYNPKINEQLASLQGMTDLHPLVPDTFMQGTLQFMYELEQYLAEITGMDAVSLEPAAGAQGELTGVMVVHKFLKESGNPRKMFIIPDTAHGTNPASIALCGYQPIKLPSDERGIIASEAVKAVMTDDVAGIMLTNPNTLGLFEENIREIAEIVHEHGGLVYCDGANLNALMGIVRLGELGVDVMHINLHKTFASPHGGGGPGAGPVCVKKYLAPYLPVPRIGMKDGKYFLEKSDIRSIGRVNGFFGNTTVLLRAYAYIRSMGPEFLAQASRLAVLNANYVRAHLAGVLFQPHDRLCMHECVFTDESMAPYKVTTLDIAKRLIDYGFHPPTVYFPLVVHGAIMIEPTESETKETIDRFIDAVRMIVDEAKHTPDLLHEAPRKTKVRRMDETRAARDLRLRD
jgi:glycine dehydrogenase subunit 2